MTRVLPDWQWEKQDQSRYVLTMPGLPFNQKPRHAKAWTPYDERRSGSVALCRIIECGLRNAECGVQMGEHGLVLCFRVGGRAVKVGDA
jgi:hypothetical protein